jgi:AraC family transcriptional regulator
MVNIAEVLQVVNRYHERARTGLTQEKPVLHDVHLPHDVLYNHQALSPLPPHVASRRFFVEDFLQRTVEQLAVRSANARLSAIEEGDPRLQHLARALRAEHETDEAPDPVYAESARTAMVVRLICAAPTLEDRRRTLAPGTAASVIEFIDAHLGPASDAGRTGRARNLSGPHRTVLFPRTLGVHVRRYGVPLRAKRGKTPLL